MKVYGKRISKIYFKDNKILYALTEDSILNVFDFNEKKLLLKKRLSENRIVGGFINSRYVILVDYKSKIKVYLLKDFLILNHIDLSPFLERTTSALILDDRVYLSGDKENLILFNINEKKIIEIDTSLKGKKHLIKFDEETIGVFDQFFNFLLINNSKIVERKKILDETISFSSELLFFKKDNNEKFTLSIFDKLNKKIIYYDEEYSFLKQFSVKKGSFPVGGVLKDQKTAIFAFENGKILFFDRAEKSFLKEININSQVDSIFLVGKKIFTKTIDGELYEVGENEYKKIVSGKTPQKLSVYFSESRKKLTVFTGSKTIFVFDAENNFKLIKKADLKNIKPSIQSIYILKNGGWIAFFNNGSPYILDDNFRKKRYIPDLSGIKVFAFKELSVGYVIGTSDGRIIVTNELFLRFFERKVLESSIIILDSYEEEEKILLSITSSQGESVILRILKSELVSREYENKKKKLYFTFRLKDKTSSILSNILLHKGKTIYKKGSRLIVDSFTRGKTEINFEGGGEISHIFPCGDYVCFFTTENNLYRLLFDKNEGYILEHIHSFEDDIDEAEIISFNEGVVFPTMYGEVEVLSIGDEFKKVYGANVEAVSIGEIYGKIILSLSDGRFLAYDYKKNETIEAYNENDWIMKFTKHNDAVEAISYNGYYYEFSPYDEFIHLSKKRVSDNRIIDYAIDFERNRLYFLDVEYGLYEKSKNNPDSKLFLGKINGSRSIFNAIDFLIIPSIEEDKIFIYGCLKDKRKFLKKELKNYRFEKIKYIRIDDFTENSFILFIKKQDGKDISLIFQIDESKNDFELKLLNLIDMSNTLKAFFYEGEIYMVKSNGEVCVCDISGEKRLTYDFSLTETPMNAGKFEKFFLLSFKSFSNIYKIPRIEKNTIEIY